jgi:integrase
MSRQQDASWGERTGREKQRLFQVGAYWLTREANSGYLYYSWYDEGSRRTRRKTTGLRDLEDAKTWLAKLVLAEPPDDPQHPDNVTLASVKRFYFEHHVSPSATGAGIRSVDAARQAFKLFQEYLDGQGIESAPKVADLTLARQEGFMRWCRDVRGISAKSISTYLSYIKAALRFAARPRLIRDAREREREARLLSSMPVIESSEGYVSKVTGLLRATPRDWIPTDRELAAIFDAVEDEHIFRYLIMALNTWARPEAITQLSVREQVSFERGMVMLNQPRRLQNKKIRPTIRLTANLRGWLLHWNLEYPLVYAGRRIKRVENRSLKALAKRAGLDQPFTRYTLRHYMATRVRRVEGIPVSREERANWLGHVDQKHRTTERWYESLDPDYLVNPARATDAILARLDQLARVSLISPIVRPNTGLVLLKRATS